MSIDTQPVVETTDAVDTTGEDDFNSAFLEASGEAQAAVTTEPAAEPTAAVTTEPAAAATTEPAAEPATVAATEPATEPAAATTEPAEPAPAQPPTQEPLDPKYLAQAIAEANRIAEQDRQKAEPQAPARDLTPDDFLDDAARASINKFKQEWPDEYAAVERMFESRVQALVGNRINQLVGEVNQMVTPLYQAVGNVTTTTHQSKVAAVHPDYRELAPKVAEWIATQPKLVQPAYLQAYKEGSADQAIDLLNAYKAAVGSTGAKPAPAQVAALAVTPPKPATPAVNKQAVAALAAVPATTRPKPAGGVDPQDFDSAFSEAVGLAT